MAQPYFNIDAFRQNFDGGAKSYLFHITPSFPSSVLSGDVNSISYLVKTSTLPVTTIEEITTTWQGFDYKQAGKRTYSTWDITYRVDKASVIRLAYESWLSLIHDPETNIYSAPSSYMVEQSIELLNDSGDVTCTYDLIGAWPSNMSEIALDYEGTDIAEFTVTYTYQYHTVQVGSKG